MAGLAMETHFSQSQWPNQATVTRVRKRNSQAKSLTSAPGCPQQAELGSSSDCARAQSRTCRQTRLTAPERKNVRAQTGVWEMMFSRPVRSGTLGDSGRSQEGTGKW
ncbi:hypothetical protein CLCR_02681 [Cladophialophora carrionii]|uniref:Uncharacterized protein n=1 Tax=Cladophialophora carrionii TaxID=86049 RepID=A0A1C1CF46_9EURO|nr:hypothetical protein CLCR_02681 [Cladophialophora carrionii]